MFHIWRTKGKSVLSKIQTTRGEASWNVEASDSQPRRWGIAECPWGKILSKFLSHGLEVVLGFVCKSTSGLWYQGPFSWALFFVCFFFFNFPTVQQGGQVILTCIHYIFPPPFLLLQHEYLDIVLNAHGLFGISLSSLFSLSEDHYQEHSLEPQNMEVHREFQKVWGGGGSDSAKLLEHSMQLQTG